VKKRCVLIIISGCLAAAVIVFLLWPRAREPEPEYNGIALSAWLERAGQPFNHQFEAEFAKAIRDMGTNALPYLVRAVDFHPSGWRLSLGIKISKLSRAAWVNRFASWVLDEKGFKRAEAAVVAFGILGRDALPALDDLRRIASKSGPSSPAGRAILTLMVLNPGDFRPRF
jgi:hypothetical protein